MKRFRITSSSLHAEGAEFEVEDDATAEQIHEASWECIGEYVDYGYEEIADD